jgi:hypothetical protein
MHFRMPAATTRRLHTHFTAFISFIINNIVIDTATNGNISPIRTVQDHSHRARVQ